MANEVYANKMEVSCKAGSGKAVSAFPDVCMTPPPPPGVPIPYPNTGIDADTFDGTRTVQIGGAEVMLKNKSYFKKSTGDEAGRAPKKGVLTGQITGKVYFNSWSMDVLFEGENVVRNLDLTTHNHGSVPGNTPLWPYLSKSAVTHPSGVCADEIDKVKTCCEGVDNPCGCIGKKKPSGKLTSLEADTLADTTAANDCLASRRCSLQPYKPNRCCPPQTPHHLIEASALFDKGRGGEGSTALQGISGYDENKAPCVCAEGINQNTGTHGLMHTFQSAVATQCPQGTLQLVNGEGITTKVTTYADAKASAIAAMQKVFPDSKCGEKCIGAQLDSYHSQCSISDSTRIKAVKTGKSDVTAAQDAVMARSARVERMRSARRAAAV